MNVGDVMTTIPIHSALSLSRSSSRRWSHVALLTIALGGLVLSLLTWRYYGTFIRGADAQMYYAQVRSLVVDGDLAYENEITQLSPQRAVFYGKNGELLVARTADGTLVNKYTFGWALITLPVYAVVHGVQSITGGDTSGYSAAYDLATALWHLLIVLAACSVLLRTAIRLTDERSASIAMVATFFGTNLAYYTCVYPTMAHAASFAMVAIAVSLAARLAEGHAELKVWAGAAVFVGLVVLLRPTDGVLMLVFAPALWNAVRRRERRGPVLLVMGVIAAMALQLIVWRISYGTWVVNSYGNNGEGFHWLSPAVPAILTSTNHGAWYFHPFLLVGFVGLVIAALSRNTSHRSLWVSMLVAYLAHVYVHAAWHDWSFSHSFGHRLFANSAPLMALGGAMLLHRLSQRLLCYAASGLALLIAWNVMLMVTFIKGGIPAVGEVSPADLLAAQGRTIGSMMGR